MTRTSSFHRESEKVFVTRESSLLMPKYQPLRPSAARAGSHFTRNFAPPRWYFLSASVAVGRYRPQSKSLPNPQENSGVIRIPWLGGTSPGYSGVLLPLGVVLRWSSRPLSPRASRSSV